MRLIAGFGSGFMAAEAIEMWQGAKVLAVVLFALSFALWMYADRHRENAPSGPTAPDASGKRDNGPGPDMTPEQWAEAYGLNRNPAQDHPRGSHE